MTAELFDILRIQPVIGSFFTKEQNRPGADKVIVLTQSYWQAQYDESPEVLGKEVRIDDEVVWPNTTPTGPRALRPAKITIEVAPGALHCLLPRTKRTP